VLLHSFSFFAFFSLSLSLSGWDAAGCSGAFERVGKPALRFRPTLLFAALLALSKFNGGKGVAALHIHSLS